MIEELGEPSLVALKSLGLLLLTPSKSFWRIAAGNETAADALE
jgi:hypothetical protein